MDPQKQGASQDSLQQNLLKAMERLTGMLQRPQLDLNNFIDSLISQKKLGANINLLLQIMSIPFLSCTPLCDTVPMKQQAAVIIGAVIEHQSDNFKETLNLVFDILTNFSIQPKIKNVLTRKIIKFINLHHKDLQNIFERTLALIIKHLHSYRKGQIQPSYPVSISVEVTFRENPFTFEVNLPQMENSVYGTLIMMGNFMLELNHISQTYILNLSQQFREINQLLLNEKILLSNPSLISNLLSFWNELISNCIRQQNQDLQQVPDSLFAPAVNQMTNWPQFYDQLLFLTNYGCSGYTDIDRGIIITNYFQVKQTCLKDVSFLIKLKNMCAQILGDLINASDSWIKNDKLKEKFISVQWSIIASYRSCVGQQGCTVDVGELETTRDFLTLLVGINDNYQLMTLEENLELLSKIVIPLFDTVIGGIQILFEDDVEEFIAEIEDCYLHQLRISLVSNLGRLISSIIGTQPQTVNFLMNLCLNILLNSSNPQPRAMTQSLRPQCLNTSLKVETAFLLLLFMINQPGYDSFLPSLRKVITIKLITQLNEYQKAFFYHFLSLNINQLLQDSLLTKQILNSTLDIPMSFQLRHFAMDLIANISPQLCSVQFVSHFMRIFTELRQNRNIYAVISHFLKLGIDFFNPQDLISFIQTIKKLMMQHYENIMIDQKNGSALKFNDTAYLLMILKKIASEKNYLQYNSAIIDHLWSTFELQQQIRLTQTDDLLVAIGDMLLNHQKELPLNIERILPFFENIFQNYQFGGSYNYAFINGIIQKSTQKQQSIIKWLNNLILTSLGYFSFIPREEIVNFEETHFVSFSNTCLISQGFLLKYGYKMSEKVIDDYLECIHSGWEYVSMLPHYSLLQYRMLNVAFIIRSLKNVPFDFPTMSQVANLLNQQGLQRQDISLLFFLLEKLIPVIPPAKLPLVFSTIILGVKNQEKRIENIGKQRPNITKNFNTLFDYTTFGFCLNRCPFDLAKNIQNQLKRYESYQSIISQQIPSQIDELRRILAPMSLITLKMRVLEIENLKKEHCQSEEDQEKKKEWEEQRLKRIRPAPLYRSGMSEPKYKPEKRLMMEIPGKNYSKESQEKLARLRQWAKKRQQ